MCDKDKNRNSKRSGNGKAQREMQNVRQETADGTVKGGKRQEREREGETGVGSASYVHGKCCKYVLKYAFIHTNMANGNSSSRSSNRNSSRQNNKTSQLIKLMMIDCNIPYLSLI